MTEVSAWTHPVPVVARELSYEEVADLDRLRAVLASAVDRTEARAISWLWDSMVAAHGGHRAPAGFVEAVATALGDLLAVHVPGVHWSVWPGPTGPTLGVASDARPHAPVVPFLDAQDRWNSRSQDWIVDYLSRAAGHLAGSALPRQRQAPDDDAALSSAPPDAVVVPLLVPDEPAAPAAIDEPDPKAVEDAAPGLAWFTAPSDAAATPADSAPITADPITAAPAGPPAAAPEQIAPAPITAGPIAPVPTSPAPAAAAAPITAAAAAPSATAYVPDMPLEDFALDALDHAMALLRETGAFDREVFVLLLDGAGRRTESCPGEPSDARFRARELVRSSGAARAAVTWIERNPSELPGPRQAFPAVVVDAWDAGVEGVRVGRRFVDDVLGTGPLGGRLVVGPVAPLL